MQIEITQEQAEQIEKLADRYYFGLFQDVTRNEQEEYEIRDAILQLADKIEVSYNRN